MRIVKTNKEERLATETSPCLLSQTNCPNCGAIIRGDECEYCGTVFRVHSSKQEYSTAEPELNKSRKEFHSAREDFNQLCKQRHLDLIRALRNAKCGI